MSEEKAEDTSAEEVKTEEVAPKKKRAGKKAKTGGAEKQLSAMAKDIIPIVQASINGAKAERVNHEHKAPALRESLNASIDKHVSRYEAHLEALEALK